MGRDEKNFAQAAEFQPSRWRRNSEKKLEGVFNSFASLPFSFGKRSCIGKKFAENQMDYLIDRFVENFDFQTLNETEMEMKLIGLPQTKIVFRLSRKFNE